jgi:hypothetical protein
MRKQNFALLVGQPRVSLSHFGESRNPVPLGRDSVLQETGFLDPGFRRSDGWAFVAVDPPASLLARRILFLKLDITDIEILPGCL